MDLYLYLYIYTYTYTYTYTHIYIYRSIGIFIDRPISGYKSGPRICPTNGPVVNQWCFQWIHGDSLGLSCDPISLDESITEMLDETSFQMGLSMAMGGSPSSLDGFCWGKSHLKLGWWFRGSPILGNPLFLPFGLATQNRSSSLQLFLAPTGKKSSDLIRGWEPQLVPLTDGRSHFWCWTPAFSIHGKWDGLLWCRNQQWTHGKHPMIQRVSTIYQLFQLFNCWFHYS